MTEDELPANEISWPPHFRPRQDSELSTAEGSLRIPSFLVDMFYLGEKANGPVDLVVVVGCLGGDLDVLTGDRIGSLPTDLQDELQAIRVAQRNRFRAITATGLYVLSLDAMEQKMQADGFNDAVYLYGKMYERLFFRFGKAQAVQLANEGRLIAGRLDLLHGYRLGRTYALRNPEAPEEQMYHFLLPAGPVTEVQQGTSIALVYPVLDPAVFDRADNSIIMLRLVYDLLSKLQQDMQQEGFRHPYADLMIPVPNRSWLEEELIADGYKIHGDVAVREGAPASAEGPGRPRILDQLRRLALKWTAPRIDLPPQAKPKEYEEIIDHVFDAVATDEDKRMMDAMKARLGHEMAPKESPAMMTQPGQPRPNSAGDPPFASPNRKTPARSLRSTNSGPNQDWISDFATPSPPTYTGRQKWWQDFAADGQGSPDKPGIVTSKDEWEAAALAGGRNKNAVIGRASDARRSDEWSRDFSVADEKERHSGTTSRNDSNWNDDF